MKPAARIEASIEVIDSVLAEDSIPADSLLTTYFRNRRYIGSQDRKAIAELFYQILRHKIILAAIWQNVTLKKITTGRDLMLTGLIYLQKHTIAAVAEYFSGDAYGPRRLSEREQEFITALSAFSLNQLTEAEQWNVQTWQLQELKNNFGEDSYHLLDTLNHQAPFDLRVNTLAATRQTVQKRLEQEEIKALPGRYSPVALRLTDRRPLGKHPLWIDGSIEVQDEGSQLITYLVDAKPGQSVWDYCAGAGGKLWPLQLLCLTRGGLLQLTPLTGV